MAWPDDDLSNANLNEDTDSLPGVDKARAELNALLLKVKAILAEVTTGATLWSDLNDDDLARIALANTFTALNTFNGAVRFDTTATFNVQSTAGTGIDWTKGLKYICSASAGANLTFTNPPAACNLTLVLTTATGTTLPGAVKWPGGVHPSLSGDTIVSLFFDGSVYRALEAVNFS